MTRPFAYGLHSNTALPFSLNWSPLNDSVRFRLLEPYNSWHQHHQYVDQQRQRLMSTYHRNLNTDGPNSALRIRIMRENILARPKACSRGGGTSSFSAGK